MTVAVAKPESVADQAIVENGRQLGFSENAITVMMNRYLKKGPDGKCREKPGDMFNRVAKAVAAAEVKYNPSLSAGDKQALIEKYFDFMVSGVFLPNSPTLMNAGREMGMLSGCFVLPIGDSVEEIFDAVKNTALIQKAGGGTGFSFDRLRPTGDYIKSSGGTTSGPISFWKVLSEATNAIQQGAFRRGANMGMMSVTHPDSLKFIFAKQDLSAFSNYNISVKITDSWMKACRQDPSSPNVVTNFRSGVSYVVPKSVKTRSYELKDLIKLEDWTTASGIRPNVWTMGEMWDIIVKNAWQTGEPGVIFIDRINQFNPTPNVGPIESTNPCGEQPLLPYEACNLGSINLGKFVNEGGAVDFDGLRKATHTAVRFLENVVEVNNFVITEIDQLARRNRKIGLGIMGFADALFKLNTGYNTEEGLKWGEKFMKVVNDAAHDASEKLAEERGCFENWKGSRWEMDWHRKQRNAACTTVAPTGTCSIIADCSCGVEPMFSLVFERNVMGGTKMLEVNKVFEKVALANKLWGYSKSELYDGILKEGSLVHFGGIPAEIKKVFVCAREIAPEWHIKMQAAFQKHCDSSISKTINFPHEAKVEDVNKIYTMAFDLGCKGVTVYRDGSRQEQPMALKVEEKKENSPPKPRKTPQIAPSLRIRQRTPFGNMHMGITVDPETGQELEIFAQIGKAGDLAPSDLEAICRLISLWLRSGGILPDIIEQLQGIGCHLAIPSADGRILSLGDALAKTLSNYLWAKNKVGLQALLLGKVDVDALMKERRHKAPEHLDIELDQVTMFKVKCPEPGCHGIIQEQEGCRKCTSCGYSQC